MKYVSVSAVILIYLVGTVSCRGMTGEQKAAMGIGAGQAVLGLASGQPTAQALAGGRATAENVFSDLAWNRTQGERRLFRGWRVVGPDGTSEVADIEVLFVTDYRLVSRWCRALFETHPHPARGCTKSAPPWRAVVTVQSQRNQTAYTLAHELWHLKGYWGHVSDGSWPATAQGQVPPKRMPRPDD